MPQLKRWTGTVWEVVSGPPGQSADLAGHLAAGDPHTGYALDSDLTTHAAAADPHTGYVLESLYDAKGDLIPASADNTPVKLTSSAILGQSLQVDTSTASGLRWGDGAAAHRTSAVNIANTETQVIGYTVPANTLRVGSVFRIKAMGLFTNTTTGTTAVWRVRFGTTTLTGNIPAGVSTATGIIARTNIPFMVEAMVTVLTTGASGTAFGALFPEIGASGASVVVPLTAPITASVVVDSTANKIIELTFISGGASTAANFLAATIVQEA
jgi:hypothetical protein